MQKSANFCANIFRRLYIIPHETVCKRKFTLTMLHCFNRLYLQHGGDNCCIVRMTSLSPMYLKPATITELYAFPYYKHKKILLLTN